MRAASGMHRWLAAGGVMLWLASIHGVAVAAGEPDLRGNWAIDASRSDEPYKAPEPKAERENADRPGRVNSGVNIFGFPVGDLIDRTNNGDGSNQGGLLHQHATATIDALTIVQTADTMRIDYGGIHTLLYHNGARMSDGDATIRADWRGGVYVIEREMPGRAMVVEEFSLERGGRLEWSVSTELESGKKVRIRRIYDRADTR